MKERQTRSKKKKKKKKVGGGYWEGSVCSSWLMKEGPHLVMCRNGHTTCGWQLAQPSETLLDYSLSYSFLSISRSFSSLLSLSLSFLGAVDLYV